LLPFWRRLVRISTREATDLHPELAEPVYAVLRATLQRASSHLHNIDSPDYDGRAAPPIKGQHAGKISATTSPFSSGCG
jgi:hypothetical protein